MFQFRLSHEHDEDAYRTLEKAVGRGIGWIELPENTSEEFVEKAEELCREKGVILTVTDEVELLGRRRLHGILLTRDFQNIGYIRENFGAHPVIGVVLRPGDEFKWLKPLDIDYIAIETEGDIQPEIQSYIKAIANDWDIPVVARMNPGDGKVDIDKLLQTGFRGICLSHPAHLDNLDAV